MGAYPEYISLTSIWQGSIFRIRQTDLNLTWEHIQNTSVWPQSDMVVRSFSCHMVRYVNLTLEHIQNTSVWPQSDLNLTWEHIQNTSDWPLSDMVVTSFSCHMVRYVNLTWLWHFSYHIYRQIPTPFSCHMVQYISLTSICTIPELLRSRVNSIQSWLGPERPSSRKTLVQSYLVLKLPWSRINSAQNHLGLVSPRLELLRRRVTLAQSVLGPAITSTFFACTISAWTRHCTNFLFWFPQLWFDCLLYHKPTALFVTIVYVFGGGITAP